MKKATTIALIFLFCFSHFSLASESDLTFENVYHKAFYRNPWIQYGILSTAIVTAVVVTTFTAGTGAPAAATGVSSVASWIAGGGAGSYMAGLSAVGSTFGGNAILGAAILNSASALSIGGIVGKSGIALASKLAIGALEAGQLAVILSEDNNKDTLSYSIVIPLPQRIGGESAQQLIANIKTLNDNLKDGNVNIETYANLKQIAHNDAIELFGSSDLEDRVVSVVALHTLGYVEDFNNLAGRLHPHYAPESSFVYYLKAISALYRGNYEEADRLSSYSMSFEPKVIEPVLINIMARYNISTANRFYSNLQGYLADIDKFSKYYYTTVNGKINAYILLATLSYINKDFANSKELYKLAYSETDWIGSKNKKASLCASIGNACYCLNETSEGKEYYDKAKKYADKNLHIESMFTYGR